MNSAGPESDPTKTHIECDLRKDSQPTQEYRSPESLPLRNSGGFPIIPGYCIEKQLGVGGQAIVYLATQIELDRLVALKMLRDDSLARETDVRRLRLEAEKIATLQHPHIVEIYELGEYASPNATSSVPFFSLEYCPGGSLENRLKGEPIAPREACGWLIQICDAIASAHARDLIHRDMKPQNVLIAANGSLKVTDFGLVKQLDLTIEATRTNAIMGTPSYMAPEQATDAKRVSPATDVYSLGAMLYEFLTGRRPFTGTTVLEILDQVRHAEPISPREINPKIPKDLDTICLKCLQKSPHRRYTTVNELQSDIQHFLMGTPILARPISSLERFAKWVRRKPTTATLLGMILGLCVLVVGFATYLAIQERKFRQDTDKQNLALNVAIQETQKQKIVIEYGLRSVLKDQEILFEESMASMGTAQRWALVQRMRSPLNAYITAAVDSERSDPELYRALLPWKGAMAQQRLIERSILEQNTPEATELLARRKELIAKTLSPSTDERTLQWIGEFQRLESAVQLSEVRLWNKRPVKLRLDSDGRHNFVLDAVMNQLPADTAIVDYFIYDHLLPSNQAHAPIEREERLLAIVLRAGKSPIYLPLGPMAPIKQLLKAERFYDPADSSASLPDLLWRPIEAHLAEIQNIYIIPDGGLTLLPFGVLPNRDWSAPLIEQYRIGYLSSLSQFLNPPSQRYSVQTSRFLLVGGPDFGVQAPNPDPNLKRSIPIPNLPGTKLEIDAISLLMTKQGILPQNILALTGKEASKDRLCREFGVEMKSPRWNYLHLATHAGPIPSYLKESNRGNKDNWILDLQARHPLLFSGVILANSNRSLQDGVLTGEDVAMLDFKGVDLTVVSGCNPTTLSTTGEGSIGIQQALMLSGAKQVLMSVWNADDAATVAIMSAFYRELLEGRHSPQEALRRSQLQFLRSQETHYSGWGADALFRPSRGVTLREGNPSNKDSVSAKLKGVPGAHPYYWGSFVVYGRE